jgi:pimeloyl-ACP methyl ester carboxylesterase
MTEPDVTPRPPRTLHGADLRGLLRLGTDAALGVTDVVEAVHGSVLSRIGLRGAAPQGRTAGLTGFVYRTVRGITQGAGRSADALLGAVTADVPPGASTAGREAALAVLNGVWGDHLLDTGNPLAIRSEFRVDGRPFAPSDHTSGRDRIVVMVHGLCMNDLQWLRVGHDHGRMLAAETGRSVVYLHYNSGRHVSDNGQDLATLLQTLVSNWPVPVRELAIVGHSMGGLVARSACHIAQAQGLPWLAVLKQIVFLGTPHHGAPLERGGRVVDMLLGVSAHAAPFARLTRARSAGIADLGHGNVQAADWQDAAGSEPRHADRHAHRHEHRRDTRVPTPLPAGVAAGFVAATQSSSAADRRSQWLGDGLVPLASALGEHRNPALALGTDAERVVLTGADHWDLLSHPEVAAALRRWLP